MYIMRTKIGKFEILRLLGNGSMGEVYLARDEHLGREVAIKTIIPGNAFGADSRDRFQQEARAMAALNHPNIVTLYDFGVDQSLDYLVMEYLDGQDLASLIGQDKVAKADLLEALAQACEGLGYAHGRGVIHRDVKPGNILVGWHSGRCQAKLMDFGIAALDHQSPPLDDQRVGTVSYMAPEYLDSGQATASGDLFAVGVILYEILSSGRKPFAGDTLTATLGAILRQPPAPLRPEDFLDVPEALREVAMTALAKEPARRYASADELASAIRKGLSAPPRAAAPLPEAIVVGRGARANCLSVRVALRQVQPGGRITVLPGSYKEAILVDKEVTIQGEGDSADVQFPAGITVAGSGTLTLARITAGNDQGVALRLLPGARAEAEDACFQGGLAGGVELGPGTEGRFLRCRFIDNGSAGVLALEGALAFLEDCELGGNRDAGLHACRDSGIQFRCCRLVGNQGMGVSAVDGASVALDRCEVARNLGPGVLLHRGGTGRLDHCQINKGLSLGIACRQGSTLHLEDCDVQGNASGGILLPHGAPAPRPGNRIEDSVTQD